MFINCLESMILPSSLFACQVAHGANIFRSNITETYESIIGGRKSLKLSHNPWNVQVFCVVGQKLCACGGCIITNYHVLTAAHCIFSKDCGFDRKCDRVYVLAGSLQSDKGRYFEVKKIYYPKHYVHMNTLPPGDIAMLTLKHGLTLKEGKVEKAKLPKERVKPDTYAQFTGYGKTVRHLRGYSKNGKWDIENIEKNIVNSPNLREVMFKIAIVGSQQGLDFTAPNRICALDPNGASVACIGDSGSPLIVNRVVVGILSSSREGFQPKEYALFTDVFFYVDDITRLIREDFKTIQRNCGQA